MCLPVPCGRESRFYLQGFSGPGLGNVGFPSYFILLFIYRQSIARDYQGQRPSDLKMYFAVLKGYWNLPNPFSLKQFIHKLASSATANGRHPPGIRMT